MPKDIIKNFANSRIMVIGDLMLDAYLWGDVKRISPEAPVQVVDIQKETIAPGGACNVAVNIASLGGKVYLGGLIGKDANGSLLLNELQKREIDVSGVIEDEQRNTITKTRIVARSQQIIRFDRDVRETIREASKSELLNWAKRTMPKVTMCVFSDYAKGISTPEFMSELIAIADKANVQVIVDPKGNGFQKYQGALLITPNIQEAELVTGFDICTDADLQAAYEHIKNLLPGTNILIKQSAGGMTLFEKDGNKYHVDAEARQVFDVTGAGDTVIAVLVLALSAGADMRVATTLANRAAGIVVGKVGTATLTSNELNDRNNN